MSSWTTIFSLWSDQVDIFRSDENNEATIRNLRSLGYWTVEDLSRLVVGRLSDPSRAQNLVSEPLIIESAINTVAGDLEFVVLYFLKKTTRKRKNNVRYRFSHFKSTPKQDQDRELDFLSNIAFWKDGRYRTLRIGMQFTVMPQTPGEVEHPKISQKRWWVQLRSDFMPTRWDEMNNRDVPNSYRPDIYGFFHLNWGINELIAEGHNPFADSYRKWKASWADADTDPYSYLPKNLHDELTIMSHMYSAISIRLIEILQSDHISKETKWASFRHKHTNVFYKLTVGDSGNGELKFEVTDQKWAYIWSVVFFINNRVLLKMKEKLG